MNNDTARNSLAFSLGYVDGVIDNIERALVDPYDNPEKILRRQVKVLTNLRDKMRTDLDKVYEEDGIKVEVL